MRRKDQLVPRGTADASDPDALKQIAAQLGAGPFALVLLFVSPMADLPRIAAEVADAFPAGHVLGCTTAGEITEAGYDEGTIVALGLPVSHFAAETLVVPDLSRIAGRDLGAGLIQARTRLSRDHAHLPEEFALLLVDGLSMKEDELTAALVAGTGPIPLVGGSSGGTRHDETFVFDGPQLRRNAAVLAVVRSACPLRTFSVDHLTPTERRMVVTDADPGARTVRRINAEPAAREYARLLGRDPAELDAFTFASHPIAVRMGGRHHVRAIQRILPSGDLVFYSAIDEGVVLTITEPQDLAAHLEAELARLSEPARPVTILAFDCILRRIEAREKQVSGRISQLLCQHNVVGFSTYGEQTGPMHVNQTLTGLALYPPGTVVPETEP